MNLNGHRCIYEYSKQHDFVSNNKRTIQISVNKTGTKFRNQFGTHILDKLTLERKLKFQPLVALAKILWININRAHATNYADENTKYRTNTYHQHNGQRHCASISAAQ
jgi:hypothetical protein